MGASVSIAAVLLLSQSTGANPPDRAKELADDLKQTLTLFETLRVKVSNEDAGKKLLVNLNEKLVLIAQSAAKAQLTAKSEDAKAKLAVVRFEALASGTQSAESNQTLALEIAKKYRESSALCPSIENLTFFQVLGQDHYAPFEDILKGSKNPEVLASTGLANAFSQAQSDNFDINRFKSLSLQFKDTKAGRRAARTFEYRTQISLGSPMPELDVELLSGYKLKVGSLKGRVVVLDFWGFWSPACVAEMPTIKDYVAKNTNKIAWIGVNTDSCTKGYLTQRLKELGANWQNTYGESVTGLLPLDFGIVAYPSKIIIDSFGIVRYVPSIRDWRPALDEALSKA
jgi:thiol-disulfide isomerase/thioredoxin